MKFKLLYEYDILKNPIIRLKIDEKLKIIEIIDIYFVTDI